MALWMQKRLSESQRKNGLYDTASENSSVKPIEPQFNYNFQSFPSTAAMSNEAQCISMPNSNDQQYQQKSTNLEHVQDSIESKNKLKYQPNMPQAQTESNLINRNVPVWTVVDDTKDISVTADRGDANVVTLPQGAYYDEPVYIDPMTYQQQNKQANSVNVQIPMNFQQNLAQSYRCTNAHCSNCKNSM